MPLSLNREPNYFARKPRYRVAFETNIVVDGGSPMPVLVRDLSDEGFMAVSSVECVAEAEISIELPDIGLVAAKVRWSEDGCIGAQFITPLTAFPRPEKLERRSGRRAEYPRLHELREDFAAARNASRFDGEAAE
jgi:hypothetical protein